MLLREWQLHPKKNKQPIAKFDNCAGSFVYKDKTGKQMTKTLTGGTKATYDECLDWMEDKMADLKASGYTLVKYSNSYNWTNK